MQFMSIIVTWNPGLKMLNFFTPVLCLEIVRSPFTDPHTFPGMRNQPSHSCALYTFILSLIISEAWVNGNRGKRTCLL
jgi:hypothetical protein